MTNGRSIRTVSQDAPIRGGLDALEALGALGDPTRRAIFERLAKRPWSVGELARELPVGRPAVSQHLKILKEAGLITSQQHGTRNHYRLDPRGVASVRAWLDGVWDRSLAAFKEAPERT